MGEANWAHQTIWTGDNLPILRGMNSESVDLIYLDPPFNSKANYAAPIGSAAAGAEFKDTWTLSDIDVEWINLVADRHPKLYRVILAAMRDSDKSYLAYMSVRLLEMRRLVKPTGSIYLHCDPTMSHYLKLVMDAIFGRDQFRNEIVWYYRGAGTPRNDFARRHDVILRYARSRRQVYFNPDPARQPYADATLDRFTHYIGNVRGDRDYGIQQLNPLGKHPDDVFSDIQPIAPSAKARLGYPTQKPIELVERIISTSSVKEDVVLDPFCGCATACIAAERLHRRWVGIDISPKAAELVNHRMHDELGLLAWRATHRTDVPQRTDLGALAPYRTHKPTLYGQQAGNCAGCSEHFQIQHLDVDHIIARSKGGTDHPENLQLLCGHCNSVKGDRGMEYLRTKLQLVA